MCPVRTKARHGSGEKIENRLAGGVDRDRVDRQRAGR